MILIDWWHMDGTTLLLQLGISLLLFPLLRFSQGWWDGVSSHQQLAEKDNLAFGISTAATFIAMATILSGVLTGPLPTDYLDLSLTLAGFGLVGIMLLRFSSFSIDRFAFPRIDKRELILNGNVAMAIVDAGAILAAAIVVRTLFTFVGPEPTPVTLISSLLIFLSSQLLLVCISRLLQFSHDRQGFGPIQQAIELDQRAIAIAHSGPLVASAQMLACGITLVSASNAQPIVLLWQWLCASGLGLALLVVLRQLLASWVMLKINPKKEIALQNNGAIAALTASLWLVIASLLHMILS